MIFDTHAHYNDSRFDEDRAAVLSSLPKNGVGLVMNACSDLSEIPLIIDLCEEYPFMYGAVGIHPEAVNGLCENYLDELKKYVSHGKIKAIGEIGLDYYHTTETKEKQKVIFSEQIELAKELKMPVIVHDRDAHGDVMDILRSRKVSECGGVFHCYSGSAEMVKEITEKFGMYIAFGGSLTFKNASNVRSAAAAVPLDRLLVETDSPYLAPVPYRGKRNSSVYLTQVINLLAEIHGKSPEEMEYITEQNGRRLFGI